MNQNLGDEPNIQDLSPGYIVDAVQRTFWYIAALQISTGSMPRSDSNKQYLLYDCANNMALAKPTNLEPWGMLVVVKKQSRAKLLSGLIWILRRDHWAIPGVEFKCPSPCKKFLFGGHVNPSPAVIFRSLHGL